MSTLAPGSSPAVFSVGNVIGRALLVWSKNFLPFTALTALVYTPIIVYMAIALSGRLTLDSIMTMTVVLSLGGFIFGLIATGAIIYGAFEELRGERPSLGKCLSVGVSRLIPVLFTGLLAGVCIGLGFLALIVPGVIIMCMLYLAVPVAVVERPGVGASLSRSKQLTDGLKGSIFLIILLFGIIQGVANKLVEVVFLGPSADMGQIRVFLIVSLVLGIIWSSMQACVNAVAYHDVRAAKEGVGLDELVSVFK